MKITVIGTGYVGLVTGTCFAESGNDVICVDIDDDKVKRMQNGEIPIYEPGLEVIFKRNIREKRLKFTTDLTNSIDSEVIFLALPTPPNEDGSADLSSVLAVADQLSELIKSYKIIVDKSTVPIGTSEKVKERIVKKSKNLEIDVVSNPEFLREGFAVNDFMKPDRVVIGTSSEKAKAIIKELYKPFTRQGNPIYFMDERSAELTKYAANSFLATKISFMNEIANLCEVIGADVDKVRLGIGSDPRIGNRFLFPGIGYGGSCFPKDVKALEHIATTNKYEFKILKAINFVNNNQKKVLVNKILKFYNNNVRDKKFALWGLAFKPDTDDIREAPALVIIDLLIKMGATIIAYDPEASNNVRKRYINNNGLKISKDLYSALIGVDALIIATEWNEFRNPDFETMKARMKKPIIFDGRNLYDPTEMKRMDYYYESIGRGSHKNE